MNDLPHSALSASQSASDRLLAQLKEKQAEQRTQQRHEENLKAQRELVESNKQVAEEVHGIRDSLQEQIDQTRKELEEAKLENKRIAKRSWKQFWLSLGVSTLGVLASTLIALFVR